MVHLNLKAGVVGLPFLNNLNSSGSGAGSGASAMAAATTMSTSTHVLYGVAGSTDGVAGLPLPTPPPAAAASPSMAGGAGASGTESTPLTLAISSDLGKDTAVAIVPAVLENVSRSGKLALLAAGASGNKVLKVLTGEADAAVLNLKASKDESASISPPLYVFPSTRLAPYVYVRLYEREGMSGREKDSCVCVCTCMHVHNLDIALKRTLPCVALLSSCRGFSPSVLC